MPEIAARLEALVPRLQPITIRHEHALQVLQEEDGPDTLHYVDPPYMRETRTGGEGYRFEYSDVQHAQLVELLRSLHGRVALSGYRSAAYDQVFADGRWHRYDAPIALARQECLWTNYPAALPVLPSHMRSKNRKHPA